MKGKKSALVLKALAVSLLCVFLYVAFVQAGRAFGSQDKFFKIALARDVAIAMDALYALPGDAYIEYPVDMNPADFRGYGIKVTPNKVEVFSSDIGEHDVTAATYDFTGVEGSDPSVVIPNPDKLIIKKGGNNIILMGENEAVTG